MNIQLKEMILTFTVCPPKLTRTVTDRNGTVIWESISPEASEVDLTEEGLNAYEEQMRMLPFWNIVEVNKVFL